MPNIDSPCKGASRYLWSLFDLVKICFLLWRVFKIRTFGSDFGRFWEIDAASDNERAELLFIRNYLFDLLASFPKNNTVYGMIHADLHPGNVLIDDGRLSVIDFDDAGFGWFAHDLAGAIFMDALTGDQQFDLP